jgi:CheY-like chemotaxis protein
MSQTILIIEDDEASRMMYNEILSMEDFNVVEPEDGHAALSFLENNPNPELILMDLTFPNMTSKDFVTTLRHNPNTANIPYIFISGQGEIREKAEELDALTYLKKPFDLDDFVNLVRTTLH